MSALFEALEVTEMKQRVKSLLSKSLHATGGWEEKGREGVSNAAE